MSRSRREILDALLGRVEFELDGRRYIVPEHPVTTWMSAALQPHPDAIVPALLDRADATHLYDRLLDDEPLDPGVCEQIGLWVLEQVGGRPWWEVHRALCWSLDGWNSFDGWARHEAGVDPLTLSLRGFVNLFVRFCLLATGEERDTWVAEFEAPPLGSAEAMEHRPEWADDAVEEDFGDAFDAFSAMSAGMMPD